MNKRLAEPNDETFAVRAIEIQFAVPCYLTFNDQDRLRDAVEYIVNNPMNQFADGVHWLAGTGSKQQWSQHDARFLGKPVDPSAPETGEPTYDDEVFSMETAAREFIDDAERQKYEKKRKRAQ